MMKNTGLIIASVVLAIALIICTTIVKDAYVNKNTTQSIPYINADLSKIGDGLSDKDSMMLYDLAAYLGVNTENMDTFKKMVEKNEIEGLPYIKINGNLVFSKKAVDQWLYDASLKHYEVWAK